jgi:predicted nucleic acid-binding protein
MAAMVDESPPILVVDASIAAKRWFDEPDSETAIAALERARRLIAPDFLVVEIANVAAVRAKNNPEVRAQAERAVRGVEVLIDSLEPSRPLAQRAFDLACDHSVSAYDALYLALAERENAPVLTADNKLVAKARAAGLGHLVQPLIE